MASPDSTAIEPSAERERERRHTGIEELDFELALGDRSGLSNQLIQAWLRNRAVTFVVYITSMARCAYQKRRKRCVD